MLKEHKHQNKKKYLKHILSLDFIFGDSTKQENWYKWYEK